MAWTVYMLRCADGSFYTGIAVDVLRRFRAHRNGTGAKYTRSHVPLAIVHREEFEDKGAALSREYAIKQLSHEEKAALISEETYG